MRPDQEEKIRGVPRLLGPTPRLQPTPRSGAADPQVRRYEDLAVQQLIDRILALSPHIRYVALYRDGALTSGERPDLAGASSSKSDRYEELIVNPTLLTLVTQRGNIDCGGVRFVLIRYGNFFQLVRPVRGGHLSVAVGPDGNPLELAPLIAAALERTGI